MPGSAGNGHDRVGAFKLMGYENALQLELCSLTAKSLTAVFLQSGSFFLQSGSRTCSLAPLFCSLAPLLQSGSLKKARLQQKRARLQKQRSQTASQKGRKGRKGAKNSQKQPDCSQIPSQTAKNRASQTAAKYRFCRARLQSRARLQPPCRHRVALAGLQSGSACRTGNFINNANFIN